MASSCCRQSLKQLLSPQSQAITHAPKLVHIPPFSVVPQVVPKHASKSAEQLSVALN